MTKKEKKKKVDGFVVCSQKLSPRAVCICRGFSTYGVVANKHALGWGKKKEKKKLTAGMCGVRIESTGCIPGNKDTEVTVWWRERDRQTDRPADRRRQT